jgi:hypothetical protein
MGAQAMRRHVHLHKCAATCRQPYTHQRNTETLLAGGKLTGVQVMHDGQLRQAQVADSYWCYLSCQQNMRLSPVNWVGG